MGLEEDNNSRDYLYGRLLAIAERIEDVSLKVSDESRTTTAGRLMQRFADRPASTWRNIELSLQPYIQRLKNNRAGFLHNIQILLDEVMGKFQKGEFTHDKSLSGEFLLAYHAQRFDFRNKKQSNENDKSQTEGTNK
jgi:CRISPR-associated protein Csd1